MRKSFNKIILCANPSHQTNLEQVFWRNFQNLTENSGWKVLTVSARAGEFDIILPARLYQVQNYLSSIYPKNYSLLPEWLDENNFKLLVDWEYKRWQELHDKSLILGGLLKLCWFVDYLIKTIKPAVVITTNKIDHGCFLYKLAGEYYNSKYYFIERSPFDSIWLESKGMFAESDIYDFVKSLDLKNSDRLLIERHGERVIEKLKANPDGYRQQKLESIEFPKRKGPIIFFPIDNALWTGLAQDKHPQKQIDYFKDFSNVDDIISLLTDYVNNNDGLLILKKHPADLEIYASESTNNENVLWVSGSLNSIIYKIDMVICQNTKIAYVCGLNNIPTIVLSPNTASVLPSVTLIKEIRSLEKTIKHLLEKKFSQSIDLALQNYIVGQLDKNFFYSSGQKVDNTKQNIYSMLNRINHETKEKLLISNFPQTKDSIKNLKNIFNKNITIEMDNSDSKFNLVIFFDISRLINEKLYHSGINRFARNLLKNLTKENTLEIIPVLNNNKQIKEVLSTGNYTELLNKMSRKPITVESLNVYSFEADKKYIYYSPYPMLPESINSILGITRVITIHDILHLTKSELYSNPTVQTNTSRITNSIAEHDICICDSEYTRMELVRNCRVNPENTFVVPLAADENFKVIQDKSTLKNFLKKNDIYNKKYLVALAQDDPRKNLTATIAALEEVLIQNNDVMIVLIASEVRKHNIMKEFELLKENADRVIFISNLNDSELATLYNEATAFIYTSMAEGFGLPIVEAISCGCPVITSSFTSIPSVAKDCALYVDPKNIDSIIDALNSVIRNSSLVEQLKFNSKQISETYTWKDVASNYRSIFGLFSKSRLDQVIYECDKQKHKDSEIIYRLFPYNESENSPKYEPINSITTLTKYHFYDIHRLNTIDIIENKTNSAKGVKLLLERSFEKTYSYRFTAFLKREKRKKAYISIVAKIINDNVLFENQKVTIYLDIENKKFKGLYFSDALVNTEVQNIYIKEIYDDIVCIDFEFIPGNATKIQRLEIGPKESEKPTIIYNGIGILSLRLINLTIRRFNKK